MSNVQLVKFNLEGKNILAKKLKKTESLSEIREKLKVNFPEGVYFRFKDGAKVNEEDEKDFQLEDIIDNNIVYLQRKKTLENKDNQNENKPPQMR